MRALLTDSDKFPFDDEDKAKLADAGVELDELAGHDPAEILEAGRDVQAIFVYYAKFPREIIERLGNCRVLARCGVGYDNIDVRAARERGIEVVYVPEYGIDDVSDHTVALLLACARKVVLGDSAVRGGDWPGYPKLAPMYRLKGRILGLLGFGQIARRTAQKARAFGIQVIAHDPFVPAKIFDEEDVAAVGTDDLFRDSDFVSVHVPLMENTRHLIGEAEFRLMKPGATLINTSRGAIVDSVALVAALEDGHLSAAGLDVFETEPLPPEDPFRELKSVVLTPHSAAYTEESLAEVRKRPLADVLRVLAGERPLDPVP